MKRLSLFDLFIPRYVALFFVLLTVWTVAPTSAQPTITRTSSPVFYIDMSSNQTPKLTGMYAAYQIQNTSGTSYDDLWIEITFSGSTIGTAAAEDGLYHLGALGPNTTKYAFFYLVASGATTSAETHTVSIYEQKPPASALTSATFTLTAESAQGANANKVNTTVATPNPGSLGGIVTITVTGQTGTIGGAQVAAYTPAADATWSADSYKLVNTVITFTGGNTGTYTNQLYFTFPNAAASDYTAVYTFRANGITAEPDAVSPIAYIQSGQPIKHTSTDNFASLAPIQPADNTTTLAMSASPTSLFGGGTTTYTLTLSNAGTDDIVVDELIDVLPASTSYVSSSSTYDGSPIDDPVISGGTLTWQNTFTVTAGGSASLTFQATLPNTSGTHTNSATGLVGAEQIDTTLDTSDDAPATADVIVYADSDLDGIPDYVEGGGTDPEGNADSDGTPNYLDPDFPGFTDTNLDGVDDQFDFDLDGIPNHLDIDSDADGITDATEAGSTPTSPRNSDGDTQPNYLDIDNDADGIPDNIEAQWSFGYTAPSGTDIDGDGLDDVYDNDTASTNPTASAGLTPIDYDNDTTPDYLDADSDGDGAPDLTEAHDTNMNGTIDGSESAYIGSDADGDGLDDGFENEYAASYERGDLYNATNGVGDPSSDMPNVNNGSDNPAEPDFRDDNSVLPVELVSFEATLDGSAVHLAWTTASETNNAGFEVQCSRFASANLEQGARWEDLGFVEGHGTTEKAQVYAHRVESLAPGIYRFRLKQLDYDGTFAYSPEVEVAVEMAERFVVEPVYPNPFNPQAQFRFAVKQAQAVRVELFDVAGRRVAVLLAGEVAAGQMQRVEVDGRGLPSGVYLVRLVGRDLVQTQTVTLLK